MGLITTKPVFGEFEINKGADQHVQSSSLISAMSEILIVYLVSVAEQSGLNLTSIGNHEDRFTCDEAI